MKSICFVITSPFTINSFLIGHLAELRKNYQVTLCVNLNIYKLSSKIDSSKISIINVPLERKISLLRDLKALITLFKIFRNSRFNCVHSITPKAGLLAMTAALITRVPNRFHTFTGQIWSTKTGLGRIFYRRIDWLIAKLATFIFADSTSQVQFLLKEGVCQRSHISLLGSESISGVDLERFRPNRLAREQLRRELSARENECVFIFVGRLCRDKGLFDLFKAFSMFSSNNNGNYSLWIIGPDEEDIAYQIKKQFPGLYDLAKWIGPTSTPELYMAAADVLLLPSHREGFGTVIIEAAACGLPTISYRIDGVVDALVNGHTGILVSLGDTEELSAKIQYLLRNSEIRSSMGSLARARACNNFSSETITKAWLDFYKTNVQ
jgi:glycosyltransferase involved in cell wall biosynthesis